MSEFVVSVVTELELLVRPIREGDTWELEQVRIVLESPGVHTVDLNRAIAGRAAELRAVTGLALPDAAIVATALHTDCDVIVGNDERCAKRVREIPYVLLDALVEEEQA